MKTKTIGRQLAVFIIILGALINGAYSIQVTVSGGCGGESSSVAMNIGVSNEASVNSQVVISEDSLTPATSISGPVPLFEQTHSVKDSAGKSAKVYVKVVNASSGLTYDSLVLPDEGSVSTQPWVSAEQWLTVPKADSIVCKASASYKTLSSSAGLEEINSSLTGDYVTLNEYYGKAYASATQVVASQTATDGSANTIKIYGKSKDSSGSYSVNTQLNGISGGKATFKKLAESSKAGTSTQVTQKEYISGKFTGTATYTPKTGTAKSKTRTSNFGTKYDLDMRAIKGKSPTGTVGYYISPGMATSSTGAIQGGVNAAQSGDIIKVAAGTYKEKVKIDKSLAIKGAGASKTIVDGNKKGSVFTIGKTNSNADVALSGMTIQGGSGTSIVTKYGDTGVCGGGVLNYGKLKITDSKISGNTAGYLGGAIYNVGSLTVSNSTISENTASWGGAMYNWGTVTVKNSSILKNTALNGGGGIYACCSSKTTIIGSKISWNTAKGIGGGIAVQGTLTVKGASTISGNTASTGGAICWKNNRPVIDSSTVITGNSKPQIYPNL